VKVFGFEEGGVSARSARANSVSPGRICPPPNRGFPANSSSASTSRRWASRRSWTVYVLTGGSQAVHAPGRVALRV